MKLVIDAPFLLHRCKSVAATQGQIHNGFMAFLFLRSLNKLIREWSPDTTYCCWDRGLPVHRTTAFPQYKEGRVHDMTDEPTIDYFHTTDLLHAQLPLMGIHSIAVPGVEADDLGYFYASKSHPGVLVSDDWDWVLNLRENWTLHRPRAKYDVTWAEVCGWYPNQCPHESYLIFKALLGDGSDGIPGIPGYTAKVAKSACVKPNLRNILTPAQLAILDRNIAIMDTSWIIDQPDIHECIAENEKRRMKPTLISIIQAVKTLCLKHDTSRLSGQLHKLIK